MKSLSETSVFKYTELIAGNKITTCIKAIVNEQKGAKFIEESQLEDVLYKIRHKSFNYSAKFAVIELFRKGIIKLVYNDRCKLTVAVPFFKYKMSAGGFGVIINITNYSKLDNDGNVKIDPLILYTLMLTAAFSLVEDKYTSLLANNGLIELYADLMVSSLNKVVNMDQVRREVYKLIFAKFMLMQLGYAEDRALSGAKTIVKLDDQTIENVDLSCPITAFDNLESLTDHLRKVFPDMSSITLGTIFDKWMRTYGEATAFAIEYMPMFVVLFAALITNCNNIVNIKAIERCANRHSSKLVVLFNKIETIVSDLS